MVFAVLTVQLLEWAKYAKYLLLFSLISCQFDYYFTYHVAKLIKCENLTLLLIS